MAKTDYLQLKMTPEMKKRVKEMSEKKSLSMSALIQSYVSMGLQNDELIQNFQTEENIKDMLLKLSGDISKQTNINK